MMKGLRRKFVAITMAIVAVMLLVIFSMVLHTTARNLERQSMEALRQASPEPMQFGRPGGPEPMGQSFFILQERPDGKIHAIHSGNFDLSDEVFLTEIYRLAKGSKEESGELAAYQLRFYRGNSPRGQQIAFADISGERQILRQMTGACLLIGIVTMGIFFIISVVLARWAVKPVEKAWQEQRQFVADASHELKTPLTVITTSAELLTEPEQPEDRREQLTGNILAMSRQMRGLVEGLLELARVDNGAVRTTFQPVQLSELITETALPFEVVLFEAGLTLECSIQPELRVNGSCEHLRQVAEILLDNARKYSQPGSVVKLELTGVGSKACRLQVSNSGQPIRGEEQKRIFKRFYRGDKARAMNQSYGLGLPIAKTIVEDHKGKIFVQNAGSVNTFVVELPII